MAFFILRNEAPLKEGVFNLEETERKNNFHLTKSASEEKKNLISLTIEDEMEKPNAKIINVGSPKAKSPRPVVKVSETHPIIYAEEGYMQNFILKRWLHLQGDIVSYDSEKENGEVQTNPNSVLQNNCDYALALVGKEEKSTFNVAVKGNKKLKRTLSGKRKINIHVLSSDGKSRSLKDSQKEKTFVQKIVGSFHDVEVPISKLTSKDRNVSATRAECNPDGLVILGVNPKAAAHRSAKANAATVAKSHGSYSKPLTMVSQLHKKGRLAHSSQLDYISITKPIKIPDCPNVNSQSFHKISMKRDHLENKRIILSGACFKEKSPPSQNNEVSKPARCSQPASCKEETSAEIKLNNKEHCIDSRKGQEWDNTVEFWSTRRSSSSLKNSHAVPDNSPEPQKKAMLPERPVSLPVNFNHPIISIPTAQCDASEFKIKKVEAEFTDDTDTPKDTSRYN
ncbi:adenosylhomocysteinase A-like [Platysternon megacephalum]|uniref:Adenosylhomocysteinase A-like n=1 Tax=Platysternon megacephalum TaxID=55544 RepID=A0A4D9DXN7_9SAUR|nr:adenosylhomocysteinase A-like [Platysternon megacephalum]